MLVELWCAPRVLCTKNSVHQDPCSPLWAQSCPVGRFLKAFTNIEAKFEKILKNDAWIFQGPVSRKNETVACVRTAAKFRFEPRAGRVLAHFPDPIREGWRSIHKQTGGRRRRRRLKTTGSLARSLPLTHPGITYPVRGYPSLRS